MADSQQYRLRLPLHLAYQVQSLAELWNVPLARVLRLAVETMLEDPDRAQALMGARYGTAPGSSTPAQREAATQYLLNLEQINLDTLLAEDHRPLPY
jgi:hypothetical protein